MNAVRRSLADIRTKAHELRDAFGDDARARALEWAAQQFEAALVADDDQLLSLSQAAMYAGYSMEHLARLVRDGTIQDLRPRGTRRIRIRRRDLPIKPGTRPASAAVVPITATNY